MPSKIGPRSTLSPLQAIPPLSPQLQRRPQRPWSIETIKDGLGLDDRGYKEMYSLIEAVVSQKGIIGKTFRSISDKARIEREILASALDTRLMKTKFRSTADCMEKDTGQAAFRALVYKISTNFRRRQQQQCRHNSRQDVSSVPSCSATIETSKSVPSEGSRSPSRSLEDRLNEMLLVTRKDGETRPVCSLRDIAECTSSASDAEGTFNLDWPALSSILTDDHFFDRQRDSLGWKDERTPQFAVIENAMQLKAVILSKWLHDQPLLVHIKAKSDPHRKLPRARCAHR